jgi:glycosyltransferase involved in cell wall biosynthesis
MATGIPVIASAVGGNVELVEDRRTGLLVAPDDVEALATAMVALHSDADRARAMGRAGRQDVDQRFSMEAMVSAYMQVYAPGIGHTPTNAPRNAQTGR